MTFEELGLAPRILTQLTEANITTPTPIQQQAIPHAMAGRDVMGLAQTGTGKTAAFGLPLVHALLTAGIKPAPKTARGLILAPTRELARQISDNLAMFTQGTHLKVTLIIGGGSIKSQINRMARGADLLVATPGRLIDLLDRRAVDLSETRFLVLDEADQMLDMGFIHALRKIAPLLPTPRQTMLFSATMPKQMAELADAYLTDAVRVEVARAGQAADKVSQSIHYVHQAGKTALLQDQLATHRADRALVFSRTKHGAERLMKTLDRAGFSAASIHGNKSQGQRERAIDAFKSGKITVLVATDVAARGIDIPGVEYVYNFDLPNVPENYIHRIGRTARAGKSGQAVAFCSPDEMGQLRDILKVLKTDIETVGGAPWPSAHREPSNKPPASKPRRPRGRRPMRKAA